MMINYAVLLQRITKHKLMDVSQPLEVLQTERMAMIRIVSVSITGERWRYIVK
jgi:hypothetical protein